MDLGNDAYSLYSVDKLGMLRVTCVSFAVGDGRNSDARGERQPILASTAPARAARAASA